MNIVIVDDEIKIAGGLAAMLRHGRPEHVVAAVCDSGEAALAHVCRGGPADVVITDIRMPEMSGLELLERLRSRDPELPVILLSGYTDFENARRAMRLGAVDYLLKPIDREELFAILDRLEQQLRERGQRIRQMRAQWLRAQASGDGPIEPLPQGLAPASWEPVHGGLVVSVRTRELGLEEALAREAEAATGQEADIWPDGMHESLLLIWQTSPGAADRLHAIVQTALTRASGGECVLGLARWDGSADSLRACCGQARQAAGYAIYPDQEARGPGTGKPAGDAGQRHAGISAFAKAFARACGVLDAAEAAEQLRRWFDALERERLPYAALLEQCEYAVALARQELDGFRMDDERPGGWEASLLNGLAAEMTFAHIRDRFIASLSDIVGRAAQSDGPATGRIVESVRQLLHRHFDQEWELSELSSRVGLNPSYLSKLFRQETGETITDYVIGVRMEKAKELLRLHPEMKNYEIADAVGYADPAYFNKLFKKRTGRTPKAYREQYHAPLAD